MYMCGFVSELSIMFPWSICLSLPKPHCLNYDSLIMGLRIYSESFPALFFKIAIPTLDPLHFHVNVRSSLTILFFKNLLRFKLVLH